MLESMQIDLNNTTLPADPEHALAIINLTHSVRAHFWGGSRRMITAWGNKTDLEDLRVFLSARHYDPEQQPFDECDI